MEKMHVSEIINPKRTMARREAEAEEGAPHEKKEAKPGMTFMKGWTTAEREEHRKALIQKLRSRGG